MDPWPNLANKALNDERIGTLPDDLWRRYVSIWMVCFLEGAPLGLIELAWRLHIRYEDLERDLARLERLEFDVPAAIAAFFLLTEAAP